MSNYKANVELIPLVNISFMTKSGQIINMTVYEKSVKNWKDIKQANLIFLLRNTQ